jgi:nicotinamidase-related amidase
VEHAILSELKPQPNELVLNKVTAGAFGSTGLDIILRNMDIKNLVIAGIVTNLCVEMTARSAVELGYNTILVEDACAAHRAVIHEATMATFGTMWGKVSSTTNVIELIHQ